MAADQVTLTPVYSDENVIALREFRNILQTTMGPTGSLKMLVTGGGYLQLTCESASLLERLDLENPVCRYIGHVASRMSDYGLYLGVLVSHLLEQFCTCGGVPKQKLSHVIISITETFQKLLTSELVCRKVDFCSINSFLPLVRSVISSKCSALLAGVDIDSFCIEIVKIFINCIDDKTNSIGRVYVKVESEPNHFSSHYGLLYKISDNLSLDIVKRVVGEVKVLVFTVKLEKEHLIDSVSVVNEILAILEQAIKEDVKIVVCQKTVSAEVKLYLMRRDIVLLERTGTDFTAMLVHISQAVPVSQFHIHLSDVQKLLGNLSLIEHVQANESDYVLLKNRNVPVGTLLVPADLAGSDHMKVLAQQAINALRCLAVHPVLTLGGGCLEVWLIAQISLLQVTEIDMEFRKVSNWVQRALLSSCGSAPPTMMDSVYHHAWHEEENRCNCGFVMEAMLKQEGGMFIPVSEVTNTYSGLRLNPPRQPGTSIHGDMIVESHQQKLNVVLSAFETFTNLSDIGLIVYKDSS